MLHRYPLVDKLFQGIDADLEVAHTVVFCHFLVRGLCFHAIG